MGPNCVIHSLMEKKSIVPSLNFGHLSSTPFCRILILNLNHENELHNQKKK